MATYIEDEKIRKIKTLINDAEKVLVLGIGEVNMGDDGFGPYVTVELHKK